MNRTKEEEEKEEENKGGRGGGAGTADDWIEVVNVSPSWMYPHLI